VVALLTDVRQRRELNVGPAHRPGRIL
jgi:hypothetical protein